MPDIDTINGIDENDVSHYNGGAADLYTSKNGDTWVHFVFGWGGTRGIVAGGYITDDMDYITIATEGNAIEFGDLSFARRGSGTCSNVTRGVFAGGNTYWSVYYNSMDYVTIAILGTAGDFGDLLEGAYTNPFGHCDGSRGVMAGGYSPAGSTNFINYFPVATHTGYATDFGNLTVGRYGAVSFNDSTRGCFMAGSRAPGSEVTIDYITIQSTGNATDFGDMTGPARYYLFDGASDATRGLGAGGDSYNDIDYVTIATTGNSSDFGNLQRTKTGGAGGSSGVRAFFGGGHSTSSALDEIGFVVIQTTGDAADFGDLTSPFQMQFGCAGG